MIKSYEKINLQGCTMSTIRPNTHQRPVAYDITKLHKEIRGNWSRVTSRGNPGNNPKDASQKAFTIFLKTVQSALPFIVIGPDRIRENPSLRGNIGIIDDVKPRKRSTDTGGGILGGQWCPLFNDMFMLGAVNSGKEVQTTLREISPRNYWDLRSNKLNMFGRELAILRLAGYTLQKTPPGCPQVAYAPACNRERTHLTLSGIWDKLNQISTLSQARELIEFWINQADDDPNLDLETK